MGTKIIEPRPAFCFSLQGRRPAGRIEAETPLPFGALPIQDPFRILSRIFATYDMGSKSRLVHLRKDIFDIYGK